MTLPPRLHPARTSRTTPLSHPTSTPQTTPSYLPCFNLTHDRFVTFNFDITRPFVFIPPQLHATPPSYTASASLPLYTLPRHRSPLASHCDITASLLPIALEADSLFRSYFNITLHLRTTSTSDCPSLTSYSTIGLPSHPASTSPLLDIRLEHYTGLPLHPTSTSLPRHILLEHRSTYSQYQRYAPPAPYTGLQQHSLPTSNFNVPLLPL